MSLQCLKTNGILKVLIHKKAGFSLLLSAHKAVPSRQAVNIFQINDEKIELGGNYTYLYYVQYLNIKWTNYHAMPNSMFSTILNTRFC